MRRRFTIVFAVSLIVALTVVSTGATGMFALASLIFDHDHHHVATLENDGSLTLRHLVNDSGEQEFSEEQADHNLATLEPTLVRSSESKTSLVAAASLYAVVLAHLSHAGTSVPPAQSIDPPTGPPLYIQKQTLLI